MPDDLESIKVGNRRTRPYCGLMGILPQEKQVKLR